MITERIGSGPGDRVILPRFQPDGVAFVPLFSRTSWNAWICLKVSATFRPTGGVSTSKPWTFTSGSMRNRPLVSIPASSS